MHLLSRALKRVRTLLFGPQIPSRRACAGVAPEPGPYPTGACPSPGMWGAILALARHRRAPHLWPPAVSPTLEYDPTGIDGMLVRAYLLPEDERTRLLASPLREVR